MGAMCCFRGFLSSFGVKDYPVDVVASQKREQTKVNRQKQTDYSSVENGKSSIKQNGNSDLAHPSPEDVTDSAARSHSQQKHKHRRDRSTASRVSHKSTASRQTKKSARSFDDSDSNTSSDSEEENLRHIRRSIRRSRSRNSRDTFVSNSGSRASADERRGEPSVGSSEAPGSPSPEHVDEKVKGYLTPSTSGPRASASVLNKSRTSLDSERGFSRKALRKSPQSGSPRSTYSQSPTYRSSDWMIDDAESLYRDGKATPDFTRSKDDEIEMAREASREVGGLGVDSEDEDFGAHVVEPISACGTLDVAIQYVMSEHKLQVTIIEAHDLPSKARGGMSIVQVRAVVLPTKKKKYKTKVQHITSPRFAETFKLSRASPEELRGLALRLRMYGIGKVKDRLIGEAIIRFDELNLIRDPQLTIQLQLEPRANVNRADSDTSLSQAGSRASSMMSLSHGGNPPELLMGLSYNPPTGRLCVEVIKGSHFRNLAMTKPPDTFVKISLLNSACQEMSQSKTTVRRGQPNPVYKETFFFQVALFQLGEVTLMVSVYNRRTMKRKEMIGWVSMGRNSSSEQDEQHWQEMKEGKGQSVCRWHTLIDT